MNTSKPFTWILVVLLAAIPAASAQVIVPADISVGFTAVPDTGLVPGEPIIFTLSATNHGPDPVDTLVLVSFDFVNEFDLSVASTDCHGLGLIVSDGQTYHYNYAWLLTLFDGTLAVGATRACHLTITLSPLAPAIWTFGFALADFYYDINPANNSASVTLYRAVAPVAPVPSLSPAMLLLLGVVLAATTAFASRRRTRIGNSLRSNTRSV